jgi:hypothetical protein
MKSAAFVSVIFLAAATLSAQKPAPAVSAISGHASAALDLEHSVSRCPIALTAHQGGGLHFVRTKDGQTSPVEMTPSITLKQPARSRIVSASITARGDGASKGAMPLDTSDPIKDSLQLQIPPRSPQRQRPSLTQTVTVKLNPDGDGYVTGEFRLPGFAVLESIQLNSVTFADGSTQVFASSSGCSVQPSLLVLVSAGK